MREQFTFYKSFYRAASRIKDPMARLTFYDTVCTYALESKEPDLDSVPDSVALAFELLQPVLDKARSKAESGAKGGKQSPATDSQTESKPEANGFVPQANGKQTESKPQNPASKKEGEKEKEVEREIEVEKEAEVEVEVERKPPKPRRPATAPIDFSVYDFSLELQSKLTTWFAYKQDRGEGYTVQQKHALLATVYQKLQKYPESAILALVDQCMVAGWKNIIFERLEKPGAVQYSSIPGIDRDIQRIAAEIRKENEEASQ